MKTFKFFKKNPDYFLLTLGSLLSTTGVAFSSVSIFSKLESINASPSLFSLAFLLECIPGVLSAWFAKKYFSQTSIHRALFSAEALAGFAMLIPIIGVMRDNVSLLLVAAVIGSATAGFLISYQRTHIRRILLDREVSVVTFLDNYSFALVFILGCLGGSLLITKIGTLGFILLDTSTYFLSCFLTVWAFYIRPKNFRKATRVKDLSSLELFKSLNHKQKRALYLNLLLIAACSMCTAVLPSLSLSFDKEKFFLPWVPLSLSFLIIKIFGQVAGPILAQKWDLEKLAQNPRYISTLLITFQLLYLYIFNSRHLSSVYLAIFMAHLASNIVFILAYYYSIKHFNENSIGPFSTLLHQLSMLLMFVFVSLGGFLANWKGLPFVSVFSLAFSICLIPFYINFERKEETQHA